MECFYAKYQLKNLKRFSSSGKIALKLSSTQSCCFFLTIFTNSCNIRQKYPIETVTQTK